MLERLGKQDDSPWVCIGDFNEVLSVNEKEGGVDRLSRSIEKFRCCLESTGLRDMGYIGSWFTWAVQRRDYGCIRERIDRALINFDWKTKFPQVRLYHLSNSTSDHCILLLRFDSTKRNIQKSKRIFRFESI